MKLALILLFCLGAKPWNFDACPYLWYPHCQMETGVDGFRCSTGYQCMPYYRWCDITFLDDNCPSYDNLKIDSCFEGKFEIQLESRSNRYLFVKARTTWENAEAFCQAKGYHLVSFDSKDEFQQVSSFLKSIKNNSSAWHENGLEFKDPLGQLCWPDERTWSVEFWLGLSLDWKTGNWEYSDTTKFDWSVFDSIDNIEASDDVPIRTKNHIKYQEPLSSSHVDDYPHILCKQTSGNFFKEKWKPKSSLSDSNTITGYKCKSGPAVMKGPELPDSQIFDGFQQCPVGEDEEETAIPFGTALLSGGRKVTFYPVLAQSDIVTRFCVGNKKQIPSIKKMSSDARILQFMGAKFGADKQLNSKFWFVSRNWSKPISVLVNHDSYKKQTPKNEANRLVPGSNDFYAYLDKSSNNIVETEKSVRTFIICEELLTGNEESKKVGLSTSKKVGLKMNLSMLALFLDCMLMLLS